METARLNMGLKKKSAARDQDSQDLETDLPLKLSESPLALSKHDNDKKTRKKEKRRKKLLEKIATIENPRKLCKDNMLMVQNQVWEVYLLFANHPYAYDNFSLKEDRTLKKISKRKWIPLNPNGELEVKVNGRVSPAGIATDEMFDVSTITFNQALSLGLHDSIRPEDKNGAGNGHAPFVGVIPKVKIKMAKVIVMTDLYVHRQRMYPQISLSSGILAAMGAVYRFEKKESFLYIPKAKKRAKWQYNYLPRYPLVQRAYCGRYYGGVMIHVTEKTNSYVTRNLMADKQLSPDVEDPTEMDERLDITKLQLTLGQDVPLEAVDITVVESVSYGKGDIVLGRNFLHENDAIVDYARRRVIIRKGKKMYCLNLFAEHKDFGPGNIRDKPDKWSTDSLDHFARPREDEGDLPFRGERRIPAIFLRSNINFTTLKKWRKLAISKFRMTLRKDWRKAIKNLLPKRN